MYDVNLKWLKAIRSQTNHAILVSIGSLENETKKKLFFSTFFFANENAILVSKNKKKILFLPFDVENMHNKGEDYSTVDKHA